MDVQTGSSMLIRLDEVLLHKNILHFDTETQPSITAKQKCYTLPLTLKLNQV